MDYQNFVAKSKEAVVEYYNTNLDSFGLARAKVAPEDVYVVWYCKTLQNAKALLSTPVSDGMYYETTFNGDKNEMYFDAYKKEANIKIDM